MDTKKSKSPFLIVSIVVGITVILLICASVFALKILLKDDQPRSTRRVQQVRLITTPPPPKVKQQLSEPIQKKEEEVIEQQQEEIPPDLNQNQPQEAMPSDDLLGLDADGGAGSDSFGLAAKKGGRPVTLGDSRINPMTQYAWYSRIIEEEIKKRLMKQGKFPDKDLNVLVKIMLDSSGNIVKHWIYNSSGDQKMDQAVTSTLDQMHIFSQSPPEGMPRTIKLKVSIAG